MVSTIWLFQSNLWLLARIWSNYLFVQQKGIINTLFDSLTRTKSVFISSTRTNNDILRGGGPKTGLTVSRGNVEKEKTRRKYTKTDKQFFLDAATVKFKFIAIVSAASSRSSRIIQFGSAGTVSCSGGAERNEEKGMKSSNRSEERKGQWSLACACACVPIMVDGMELCTSD